MNAANWNLDELVERVMADLRAVSSANLASSASVALSRDFAALQRRRAAENPVSSSEKSSETTDLTSKSVARQAVDNDDAFVVSERLLVAETVRRFAASTSAKRWRVQAKVVVTPSARDELKKAGVELVSCVEQSVTNASLSASNVAGSVPNFATGNFNATSIGGANGSWKTTNAASRSAEFPILLAVHLPAGECFPKFVDDYLTRNFAFNAIRLDCLKETTKRIAAEIEKNSETRTILTTQNAAIGSVWANRLSGVRAAVAFSVEQAKRDVVDTNANVVIVDPRDVGPYPFRQIVEFFLTRKR